MNLSSHWKRRAILVGIARQDYAEANALKQYGDGSAQDPLLDHILACLAECSVAKVVRQRWHAAVGETNSVDVGTDIEVRARRVPGTGVDLAIRPKDHDQRPYVLVHARADWTIDVIGWLYGQDGKNNGPWCQPKRCWFVPPPYRSVDELIALYSAG